ncbi:HAD-IC family P-type ATPase [Streptomyces sp. NPDC028635]|uniref:HAD-IC family P-type ATPase n=1 Tax=Streptomyces sp. NPDC028635 TaxID=3154800 RepID=UPI00340CA917
MLEVLRGLGSGPRGLTEAQAQERLARCGDNVLPARREASWPRLFARSAREPFTAVLLCLGLVSAVVLAWGTAAVILLLVAVSCVLRASGEHRADRSTAALRRLVATTATVRRRADEGATPVSREIPVGELVPGDIVRLGPGDLVPADVRLLRARGLTVHQSALTGESAPVAKSAEAGGSGGAPDQPQHCYQGSGVVSGSATAVVTATGARTRLAAAHARQPERRPASAFDRSVHGISWILIRFMLLTPPLVLMANAALRDRGLETLPFAVAVAVGLTPEMLPVLVTTCLARGAALLARTHGVIVRRLPALHDLGAADVLCVDKTGTLTQDRPVVHGALDPTGRDDPDVLHWAAVNAWWTLHLADLPEPDALDDALLEAALPLPADEREPTAHDTAPTTLAPAAPECEVTACLPQSAATAYAPQLQLMRDAPEREPTAHLPQPEAAPYAPRAKATACVPQPEAAPCVPERDPMAYDGVAALPFDPLRRLATAVVRTPGRLGRHTLVVKGDATSVLERCALTDAERARAHDLAARHAGDGLRVLAVATAERPARTRPYTPADERGLTFRGLVTLRDALTPSAADALRGLAAGGVTVKILTGDHPATAARACRDLGLHLTDDAVVVGDRVDSLGDAALADLAGRTTVFARCTPDHKARITGALRAAGHTVGFLGDGVNDLPALRTADVGIAPRDAADVAREGADVVLAEKDLTAIAHAIAAGRRAGGNIATYLRVTLSSNLGNVIAMLSAGLLLPFLPMLPAQVLVQNLFFDAAQLAFAHDRPHPAVLRRPTLLRPRDMLRFLTVFGALNAVADLATFAVLALTLDGPGTGDDQAVFHSGWFTENLLTQALVMLLLRAGRRAAGARGGPGGSGRRPGPVAWAALALVAVGLALPPSPLGPALGLTALPAVYYALLAAVLAVYAVFLLAARARYERRCRTREHCDVTDPVEPCAAHVPPL